VNAAAVVIALALGATVGCSNSKAAPDGARPQLMPSPGQTIVTGLVEGLVAENAQSEPLAPPFTISAAERGTANLTIENAMVDGRQVAINWGSGTPLPIGGAGGLDFGAAHVEADGSGLTWSLDGEPREFLPGEYRANAPVAVGPSGIATPREGVDFQAGSGTVLIARGGTLVHVPPRLVTLEGPGKVTASGQLRVRTTDGEKAATQVELREGPFKVTLEPAGSQLRIEAVLQGPVTAS
jgi:hypothetical protein